MLLVRNASRTAATGIPRACSRRGSMTTLFCLTKPPTLATSATPSIQDWYVRYGIAKSEGVAEVASVGGFVKQYSVVIDPRRLQALGIPVAAVRDALRTSNMDVGGRTIELAETEFAVRGRGYIKSLSDLEQVV